MLVIKLPSLLKALKEMKENLKVIGNQQGLSRTNEWNDLCQVAVNTLTAVDEMFEEK